MSEYIIQDSTLTNIADAIRTKDGSTGTIAVSEMASKISNIKSGFPNGMEWTQSNVTDVAFSDVRYADGIWVALSDSSSKKGFYYSIDGKTWTQSNITTEYYNSIFSLRCDPAIGNANGLWLIGSYYSTDGKTWVENTNDIVPAYSARFFNANGVWIAGANGLSMNMNRSVDGINWTLDSSRLTIEYCYANGIWVSAGNGMYYSVDDGITWTQTSTIICGDVRFGKNIWVAAGYDSTGLYYSLDGMTWTQSNITSITVGTVCYANGIWVACSYDNGIYYSLDGMVWTLSTSSSHASKALRCYYANGIWLAFLEYTNNAILYSTDGKEWTRAINIPHTNAVYNANGIWVAATDNGLYYSVTWEP